MKENLKHLISFMALAIFVFIAFGSMDDDSSSSSSSSSNSVSSDNSVTTKQVGETLSTQYFDVTINKVSLQDRVSTGNQFADLKKEEGNQYLVLNTTFKNTDDESRMIMDGEVLINYNGKEYLFDKSETVMLEGWGLMLDQINPLTSKTTNLVYKIPSEITGPAYYRPGRSNSDDLIVIGNIQ
ncbi:MULTISPECIES: DUF4352 domain-containing protein [Robiginitalea]|uniref:DUF4352 domain-containing protein n=1 Tax=Robiginitalea TaxID=252306 RepID=UPI000322C86E|nr:MULTISPECIES: DUF4352 domain-containing protein [Robiginitalea]MDC6353439.1 DUF4352 domain-containing protein [Robiginitalea sp. PM2]MDC6373396.1 DUF4352 domain-containing protein [Robiginitalea sp. SP8]